MKIAFVGKGGSGKSACTWLFAHTLAELGKNVFVIDADHNMDTASTFGVDIDTKTATFHRTHSVTRELLQVPPDMSWRTLLESPQYPTAIPLRHEVLQPLWHQTTNEHIHVAVVGLGADDIIGSGKCTHGHSAPLKWLLPCLAPSPDEVLLIDGVAGADMMNYGLFSGVDALIIVAEHHPNSERVAEQIINLAQKTNIPYLIIGNRSAPHLKQKAALVMETDPGIATFDYTVVSALNKNKALDLLPMIAKRDHTAYIHSLTPTS